MIHHLKHHQQAHLLLVFAFGSTALGFLPFSAIDHAGAQPVQAKTNQVSAEVNISVEESESSTASNLPPQVHRINTLIEQGWSEYELQPSKQATDNEWCRRVYLDLIGRVPSVAEVTQFVKNREEDKRLKLIEKLLYSDDYTEEFARNWTTVWTNLLIGRTGGTANGSMINRAGMQKYLRDSFAREKPYNKMVAELVTATGTTAPGDELFNGATNFLIDKVNQETAVLATSATTRIFMGLQVQCAQCHKHPFNEWEQQTFWEMNAFFRQARAFPRRMAAEMGGNNAELADQDFKGESGRNEDQAEIYYENRNGLIKVAYPKFVDGKELPKSGLVNVVNRRKELATLMTESPFVAKSIANRMWAHFLGYGFTSPIDDLGPHNIPSNPVLLDYISEEFKTTGQYDLRELMKWIVLSKPYSLSSRRNKSNQKDDPLLGVAPRFSHFYLRQMQAEQLYESLLVATQAANSTQGTYEEREARKNGWLQQFNRAFGTDEGGESTDFNGTIPQVLMMFNGEMIKEATKTTDDGLMNRLANSSLKPKEQIEALFLAGLGRKPNRNESSMGMSILKSNTDIREGLRDLWWVILNTNEFIFIH